MHAIASFLWQHIKYIQNIIEKQSWRRNRWDSLLKWRIHIAGVKLFYKSHTPSPHNLYPPFDGGIHRNKEFNYRLNLLIVSTKHHLMANEALLEGFGGFNYRNNLRNWTLMTYFQPIVLGLDHLSSMALRQSATYEDSNRSTHAPAKDHAASLLSIRMTV